jgi:protease secretion system membrane fusion protein
MSKLETFKRIRARTELANGPVTDIETVAKEVAQDMGRTARIGLWALVLGFGGFLLWATLAPLDEGVPGPGTVSIDTRSQTVQHPSGGIVKEVLVKEGEQVKAGQLLLRLDAAAARANFEAARQRFLGLSAMQARLQAEQRGAAKINFSQEVMEASKDPQIAQVLMNQEQLFGSRRLALKADLQAMSESIEGQQGLITGYKSMLASRTSQQALISEELKNTTELVKEGYAPRNRQLELQRMVAESASAIAELQANIIRAGSAVSELRQRMISRQQDYLKEVESQLADVSLSVQGDGEKYKSLKDELSRVEIRSPADGQVVGLAFQTVGAVIGPGQKLMDIVPDGRELLIEVHVPPHLIDRVQQGLAVDVRFSSFSHTPQLVVDGQVKSVSSDLLTDPRTGMGYYLARVGVTESGYKSLGKRQMQSGMPVEVIFRTGERSMLTYLLSPLTRRLAASMKEE